jgi:hypothetical protein
MNFRSIILAPAFILPLFTASAQKKNNKDSITIAVYPQYNQAGPLKRSLLGKNYRKLWATPVKMKIFHLNKEKGGLKITDEGGGNQTNSLHLVDAKGEEWVLRSVQKTTSRELPKYYNHTIVTSFLQDEVSTQHPFAPLSVPPLADALEVPHAHPQLVYLADDADLGQYRKKYSKQVYFFEESKLPGKKEIKTEKLQDKLEGDNDLKVDQKQLLRARLLDMIMGDWDRHGDQWRWRKEEDTTKNLYEPVPRDRDKVFYTTDGLLPYFIAKGAPKLQPFKAKINNVGGWNSNAVNFDLYFLNQLSMADWEEQINYVQAKLTDQLITKAVKLMPPNIYALSGPKIIATVIGRRNNIKKYALEYYAFLSKTVDIPASDKNKKFTVNKLANGNVSVVINKLKADSVGKIIYERTFDPKQTKEIHLFGLDGKNVFSVSGNESSPIKIRMIGGNDADTYQVNNDVENKGKLYVYDRSDQKNNLPQIHGVHLMTSTDSTVNQFERPVHTSNSFAPLISLGYSPEDGVQLIGGLKAEKFGFKRNPYVYKQELKVSYTLAKQSFIITYKGDFKKVIGDNDLEINILERGPKNVNNFFGLGNQGEFVNAGTKTFDYYRNRYDYTVADVRLAHQFNNWQISGGLIGQYYTSLAGNNGNHFFGEYNQLHPELNLFATKFYAGLIAGVLYDKRDNTFFTTKGVQWKTTFTGLSGLNVHNHTNGSVLSTFNFYLPLKDSTIVLADRTGAGDFIGQGEFFQMMQLGGPSLQGYHTSRFIGNQVVFNNLELRLKVCDFHTYLMPGALGLVGYNDVGRVWLDGETSHTWHEAYGAGFYVIPYHAFVLEAVIGHGTEGWLTYYSIGFRF